VFHDVSNRIDKGGQAMVSWCLQGKSNPCLRLERAVS
jgi:hypothetical protein